MNNQTTEAHGVTYHVRCEWYITDRNTGTGKYKCLFSINLYNKNNYTVYLNWELNIGRYRVVLHSTYFFCVIDNKNSLLTTKIRIQNAELLNI